VTQVDNIDVMETQADATEPNPPEATLAAEETLPFESELTGAPAEAHLVTESSSPVVEEPASGAATDPDRDVSDSDIDALPAERTAAIAADEPTADEAAARENGPEVAAKAVAADEAPPIEPVVALSPEERVASLEAEVNAAPHKVYSLGKVRRVLTELKAAGEAQELRNRLKGLETGILAQIAERKAAKEAICTQAEELKESNEWRVTGDKLRGLFEEWKLIGGAGKKLDDELWQRFIGAREHFSKRRTEHFAERQQVWAVAREKKEALIAEAEAFGASTEWRSTADKIRSLQDQWKAAGSAGREADDTLWNRFNAAKQAFFDTRTAVWDANKLQKETLCLEAEALKESSEWRLTGEAMKAMQVAWKDIGSAGKASEDRLWQRFRAATNFFFERREAVFAGKRQDERENLVKKQDLVAKAEALLYSTDGLTAAREARALQAQWKAVSHGGREQADDLSTRFRTATDRISETATSERDRQQTEWQIRMKDAMTRKREQLSSTRVSIEADEANLQRWRASLSEVRPGGKSAEIEASLDSKILDVINRIRAKNERVEELRATIADMDAKLKD